MLIEKHNKRQKMHEELLVSLSMKEMGVSGCSIGDFFQAMIESSQIAQNVHGNFPLHTCISNVISLFSN